MSNLCQKKIHKLLCRPALFFVRIFQAGLIPFNTININFKYILKSCTEYMDNASHTGELRNLICFWFLGLTNNFGYVVMLSAAHDILSETFEGININEKGQTDIISAVDDGGKGRDCSTISTGAILLADILPALAIKFIAPFVSFHVHRRIFTVVMLATASYLLVAFGGSYALAILGVMCASMSAGLGESTLLAYSTNFNRNVISTWSSGTGGAGIFGALAYASLTAIGLSTKYSMLSMLIVPALMSLIFWCVLEHPNGTFNRTEYQRIESQSEAVVTNRLVFLDQIKAIVPLLRYTLPLMMVYFAEYLINQGLLELIYFPEEASWINHSQQYRWYQVLYQIGVLVSRSSVNLVHIKNIWALSLLQWINLIVFLFGAIYWFIGSIWILFALILWEGLLGGAAYVNTFYRLSTEIDESKRDFGMQITALSDSIGIAFAGFLSIKVHNVICEMPI